VNYALCYKISCSINKLNFYEKRLQMKNVREVTVFTNGDSSNINTWSNVPFFFTETLITKGIKVNRVDMSPSLILEEFFNKTIYRLIKKIIKHTTYDYFRSYIHFINVRSRIKKAIKQYPNSDANIFLTFSFSSAGMTNKPSVLFGDWTYQHYCSYFLDRKPDFLERKSIKRENSQIEKSDLIFPLFPKVAKYMKEEYTNKRIYYLGNVINSLSEAPENEIVGFKEKSDSLLFVGSEKYMEGANTLIKAFRNLKQSYPNLSLHIIGMTKANFKDLPEDVNCYGYLEKGKDTHRELYYKLFREAKMFINTTPKWGAFSATIEAMCFYNPIIVSPYDEFVETFGRDINFGFYCEENSEKVLQKKIIDILNSTSYNSLCCNSHSSVKEFTWNNYIDKLIKKIQTI
jgi:glycosyltransferase involved in cell wall biosynthesis